MNRAQGKLSIIVTLGLGLSGCVANASDGSAVQFLNSGGSSAVSGGQPNNLGGNPGTTEASSVAVTSNGEAGTEQVGGAGGISNSGTVTSDVSTGGVPTAIGGSGPGGTTTSPRVSVLQHHNHASRDGVYVDPTLTQAAVAGMHVDTTFAGASFLESQPFVYAQPLYLASSDGGPDLVIQVTEQNYVYAFDAGDGSVVYNTVVAGALQRTDLSSLDSPVGHLNGQCGNIKPYLGITGTPIIDPDTRTLYLDAMTNLGTGATAARHLVYALNADTGTVLTDLGWPVDLDAKVSFGNLHFNSFVQNQRGALALLDGKLFVPFGGHWGDCGDYHGWIVGIDTLDPSNVVGWATRAIAGGVWAPGGIASDGKSIYFVTGNTEETPNIFSAPDTWQDGETIFKLSSNLSFTDRDDDYFVPSNWIDLDTNDQDLGGTGPVVFDLPGSTPSAFVIAFGKDGGAYMVNRDALGGISNPVAGGQVSAGEIINAAAVYPTANGMMIVIRGAGASCPAGQSGGLTGLNINAGSPPTITTAWCGGPVTQGSPAVSMTDETGTDAIVWIVGSNNNLYALDAVTGATIFAGGSTPDAMSTVSKFTTPIIANGRVFVGANARVYAFTP